MPNKPNARRMKNVREELARRLAGEMFREIEPPLNMAEWESLTEDERQELLDIEEPRREIPSGGAGPPRSDRGSAHPRRKPPSTGARASSWGSAPPGLLVFRPGETRRTRQTKAGLPGERWRTHSGVDPLPL